MKERTPTLFTERVSDLMKRRFLTKKDMAERLNVDYSTFWRKLNGKRNVDMALLKQIADILGTSVAYLIGETDKTEAIFNNDDDETVSSGESSTQSDASKETFHQEKPGHLIFKHGDYYVDVPDTPSNQAWFHELTMNMLMSGLVAN